MQVKHKEILETSVTPRTHDHTSHQQIDKRKPSHQQIAHRRPVAMQTKVSTLHIFASGLPYVTGG
jgi:hypothetical protein